MWKLCVFFILQLIWSLFLTKSGFATTASTPSIECKNHTFANASLSLARSNGYRLYCHQFSSWSEWNSYLNTHVLNYSSENPPLFSLKPSTSLLLTNELRPSRIQKFSPILYRFYNLNGLNVFPWPCSGHSCDPGSPFFYPPTFEFYPPTTCPQ
jgi:hypothetical protein